MNGDHRAEVGLGWTTRIIYLNTSISLGERFLGKMVRGSIGRPKNRLRVLGLTQWLDEYLGCGTSWLCVVGVLTVRGLNP